MCFTPWISLTTAIIEFIVAIAILSIFRKNSSAKYYAMFIFTLGLYQLSEFMLCTSTNPLLWGKVGFLIYNLLPAMALYFVCKDNFFGIKYDNLSIKPWMFFIPTFIFSVIAIFKSNFITEAVCSTIFIQVQHLFFSFNSLESFLFSFIYWVYYFGYIGIVIFLSYKGLKKLKKNSLKFAALVGIITAVSTITLPLILIAIFPHYGIMFPSIYCEFAFLFSISAIITLYFKENPNKLNKFLR